MRDRAHDKSPLNAGSRLNTSNHMHETVNLILVRTSLQHYDKLPIYILHFSLLSQMFLLPILVGDAGILLLISLRAASWPRGFSGLNLRFFSGL